MTLEELFIEVTEKMKKITKTEYTLSEEQLKTIVKEYLDGNG